MLDPEKVFGIEPDRKFRDKAKWVKLGKAPKRSGTPPVTLVEMAEKLTNETHSFKDIGIGHGSKGLLSR